MLSIAYQVILPIMLAASVGFWIGRTFRPDTQTLSMLIIYVLLPALVLQSVKDTDISVERLAQVGLVVALHAALMLVLGGLTGRRLPPETRSSYMLGILLANTGNYGLPVLSFAFGEAALDIGVIVVVCTSIVSNTVGIYLAIPPKNKTVLSGINNVLHVPLIYVMVIGFGLNFSDVALPLPLDRVIDLFGQGAIPVMLLVLGIQLSRIHLREMKNLKAIGGATAIRLLVAPPGLWLITSLLGISGLVQQVLIVQLSMPTAVNAAVLTTQFGGDPEFVTTIVFVSTVLSILSLSVLLVTV